jgi:hypothetical protein
MISLRLLWLAVTLFFCTWAALLARLKGYSALCWFLAGGPVGVLLLSRLRSVNPREWKERRKANRLGLVLSGASLLAACLCKTWPFAG